jgi:predicted signal transduction protein with EAL and GGDEF domain
LLAQIGPRLSGVLRERDTVARLGGDEFAVLLPRVGSLPAAVQVAEKLLTALHGSFLVDGAELDVEASIGVVLSGGHGADPATLMRRADVAMYAAKQRNLGVYVYDPVLDTHSPERLSLLGELRRALDHDELFLVYQPKVSLSSGQVCSVEALVRWQHPHRGLVPPDDFIPLAENTGLIGPLTRRVLDLALAQARRWADAGSPLQVAVHLSARNLLDECLDTLVADLLGPTPGHSGAAQARGHRKRDHDRSGARPGAAGAARRPRRGGVHRRLRRRLHQPVRRAAAQPVRRRRHPPAGEDEQRG